MSLQGTERQPIVITSDEAFTSKNSALKTASVEPSTVPKAKKNYKKYKGSDKRQGRSTNEPSPSDPQHPPRAGEPNTATPPSKKRKVQKPSTAQPPSPLPNSQPTPVAPSSKSNFLTAPQTRQSQQGQHNHHGRQQKHAKKRKHTPESESAREVLVFPDQPTYSPMLTVMPPFMPPPPTITIPTTSSPKSFTTSLPTPETDIGPPPLPLSHMKKSAKHLKRKASQPKQGNKPTRHSDIKSQPGVYSSVFPTDHIRTVIFENVPPSMIREGPLHVRNWLFPSFPVTAIDLDEGNCKVLLEFAHVMYAVQVLKCARVPGYPGITMFIRRPEMGRTEYITGPRMEHYATSAHPYALSTHNLLPPPYQLHPPPVPLHASPMPPPDHLLHPDQHYLVMPPESRSRSSSYGEPFQEPAKLPRQNSPTNRQAPHPVMTRVFDDPIAPPHPLFRSSSEPALRRRPPTSNAAFQVSANAAALREQLERQKYTLEKELAAKRQRLADLRAPAPEIDLTSPHRSPINRSRSPIMNRSPVRNRAPTPTPIPPMTEAHIMTEISPVSTGTVTSRTSARSASGCSAISESTTVSTSTTVTSVSASTNMSVATSVSAITSISSHSASSTSLSVSASTSSSATVSMTASDINNRRKAVEAGVAHSKMLMSKFAAATSKVERDALMAELREHTRRMAEQPALVVKPPAFVCPRGGWPTTKPEGVIIWLSDDEEEIYDDDGEIVKDRRDEPALFDGGMGFDSGEEGFDDYDEDFDR